MTEWKYLLFELWTVCGCAAAVVSLPGSLELLMLMVGSVFPRPGFAPCGTSNSAKIAVVIPAHNEAETIARTLRSLHNANGRNRTADIIVVADNCSDRTEQAVQENGARVLVRQNANLRGKGYALDFAFRTLMPQGYDAFLIVDADTEVAANFLSEMIGRLNSGFDVVQARYLLMNPDDSTRTRLTSVGNRAFNVLRARGREHLGLSCGLYGNGFGITRTTLESVPYSACSIVEDLEYHLALVRSGRKVRFVETTSVYGETPVGRTAARKQRTRWEGGRLRIIREHAPGLITDILHGRWVCLEPCLDLLLLPLTFHVMLLLLAASTPLTLVRAAGVAGLVLTALHLFLAILIADGTWSELTALIAAPVYIVWKLLLLPALAHGSKVSTTWVRTERNVGGSAR